jgi:hypothetical protein
MLLVSVLYNAKQTLIDDICFAYPAL